MVHTVVHTPASCSRSLRRRVACLVFFRRSFSAACAIACNNRATRKSLLSLLSLLLHASSAARGLDDFAAASSAVPSATVLVPTLPLPLCSCLRCHCHCARVYAATVLVPTLPLCSYLRCRCHCARAYAVLVPLCSCLRCRCHCAYAVVAHAELGTRAHYFAHSTRHPCTSVDTPFLCRRAGSVHPCVRSLS